MKPWLLLVLLLAFAYQLVALPLYRLGPVAPDFVLVVVAYVALHETRQRALVVAALSGLLVDGLSLEPWGAHGLGYTVAALVLLVLRRMGRSDDALMRFFLAGTASLIVSGLRLAIVWEPGTTTPLDELLLLGAAALYNGALALVIFGLLDPLRTRLVTPLRRRLW